MFDFRFADRNFAATTIEVVPTSAAGRALFAAHFGAGAVSATLTKSGGYEMMQAVADAGLTYQVETEPVTGAAQ